MVAKDSMWLHGWFKDNDVIDVNLQSMLKRSSQISNGGWVKSTKVRLIRVPISDMMDWTEVPDASNTIAQGIALKDKLRAEQG